MVLLGGSGAHATAEFGGTQYAKVIHDQLWGLPPISIWTTKSASRTRCGSLFAAGLVESAHDLSDGGLAVALAECSFGPRKSGAEIRFDCGSRPGIGAFPRRSVAHPDLDAEPGKVLAIGRKKFSRSAAQLALQSKQG